MLTTTPRPFHLDHIDYRDHFELTTNHDTFATIDAFVAELALRQPKWLTRLSMGIGDHAKLEEAVGDGTFEPGEAIGNWQVLERRSDAIILGEDMGMMRYELTYTWHAPNRISAETEVMFTTKVFGPFYWTLAAPMHRRFLPMMLRNATDDGTVTKVSAGRPAQ